MLDAGDELWLWQGWWPEAATDDDATVAEQSTTTVATTTTVDNRGSSWTRLQAERRAAMQTALDYWKRKHGDDDCSDPKAYLVWAGLEPLQFTDCFPEWCDRDDIAEISMKVFLSSLYDNGRDYFVRLLPGALRSRHLHFRIHSNIPRYPRRRK